MLNNMENITQEEYSKIEWFICLGASQISKNELN